MELQDYEKKHLELVKNTAADCTLFLKKNGAFPLDGPCKIAAYGNGVRHTVKGGTGSGEVNSRFSVNVEEGLKNAGFEIISNSWLDEFDSMIKGHHDKFIKSIKAEAKAAKTDPMVLAMGRVEPLFDYEIKLSSKADACIFVLARNSGEGSDRKVESGDVKLTKSEIRDILALNEKYEKFMLVLNVGGPVDLSPVMEVSNILLLSQLGVVTGTVLADILLGKANPSGKLTTTWAKAEDYSDIGDFGDFNDNNYKEGIYVGYRYFDTVGKKPLFPFGYGLSYSEFTVKPESIVNEKESFTLKALVTNTSATPGKEAVQVYISAPSGKLDKPYQQLVGFAKSSLLAPGASESVAVDFKLSDMASYDESTASYILDAGLYVVRVGDSSDNTSVAGVISISGTVTTMQARNCLGDPGFEDFKSQGKSSIEIPSNIPIINISQADFNTKLVSYDQEYPIDEVVDAMTDEELVYGLTGAFDPNAKGINVIGNAAFAVAGAAGQTTTKLKDKGVKTLVMADGPAGLRLAKEYFVDEKGVHGLGGGLPDSMKELMGGFKLFIMNLLTKTPKPKSPADIKYQYATAIPIGTAIAQSFDYDLAKSYGDIVGDEMERFGVHLWLAPALNIHRSILCGRNFEYYSEDPVVAGNMAAAITTGVQAHPGCATTIKHYAANNAETNRYNNNSHVSERAMREIYLRGFGICVRKSQPHALMTSYNLLNGTHTAEHRGLIEDILRCEYGYEGIVMTDWVIDMFSSPDYKYRGTHSDKVAIAGGDLFMPGCKGDYDRTLAALKDGSLTREQAKINVTRTYRMAEKLVK